MSQVLQWSSGGRVPVYAFTFLLLNKKKKMNSCTENVKQALEKEAV